MEDRGWTVDPRSAAHERMQGAREAEIERLRAMTPAERLAEAIALSRLATELAHAPKRDT